MMMEPQAEIEELKNMEPQTRHNLILQIYAIEKLTPSEEGVELNEGYTYQVDGSFPQLADGIAKMCLEMDQDPQFGQKGGAHLIALIGEYYLKNQPQGGA